VKLKTVKFSIVSVVIAIATILAYTVPTHVWAARSAAKPVTIVYWSMFSEGEPLQVVLANATANFEKKYPNIHVEIKWAGRQVLTQLQSALAAHQQVDIVDHSDDRVFNAIVKTGLALPLDKYLNQKAFDSNAKWKDTFVRGSLNSYKYKGHTYMVPRDDYISSFFYNQKMLNAAGIKPAMTGMTWSQFISMLNTLKKKDPDVAPLGADASINFYNNWWFTYLAVREAGAKAFHAAAYDKSGKSWGKASFRKAATLEEQLIKGGYFQKAYQGSVYPAAQVQWVNGKVAMMFMGAWLPAEMSKQTPKDFKMNMFAFPNLPGGKGNNVVEHWANTYGVLKATKHPQEVATYLKYILSKTVGKQITAIGTTIAVKGVKEPPVLNAQYSIMKKSTTIQARANLNTELPDYMNNAFNPCDDKFFTGDSSVSDFISCLETSTKKYWSK
jgi:ABC-type glycerol-3-phosphate transport system substrate-binding protein